MSILFTLKGDWIDGSTEFKCNRRHSASFPDTIEITSSTYRFQKKGLTGEVVLRQKDSRWIISSTGKEALSPREASSLSVLSATLTARSAKNQLQTSNALDEREPATGFAVIPYIQGVTEPIKIILNSHNVKVAQKRFSEFGAYFRQI